MSVIPPDKDTWLVTLECKQTSSFLNGDTIHGTVGLGGNELSGTKWAMTSIDPVSVSLRCMGTVEGPRFLNGLTAPFPGAVEGTLKLASVTSGVFTGTHWFAFLDQSDPNAIELICQGAAGGFTQLAAKNGGVVLTNRIFPVPPNALWRVQPLGLLAILQTMGAVGGARFLNGHTGDNPPTVDLQGITSGPNTGTLWLLADAGSGNVTISCQGYWTVQDFLTD